MTRWLVTVWLVACSSGSTGPTPEECDQIAREIRDKAGTRSSGICTSTVKEDVDRFGAACARLRQCS
jgi:hypothetical protein